LVLASFVTHPQSLPDPHLLNLSSLVLVRYPSLFQNHALTPILLRMDTYLKASVYLIFLCIIRGFLFLVHTRRQIMLYLKWLALRLSNGSGQHFHWQRQRRPLLLMLYLPLYSLDNLVHSLYFLVTN